jgi:hypothetical protein
MKLEAVDPTELSLSFNIDDKEKDFVFPSLMCDGQKLAVSFEGTLVTDGLTFNKFEKKDSYSLGITVNKENLTIFNAIANSIFEKFKGWDVKSVSPDGEVMFMNLKHKNNVFSVESNVPITPKKFAQAKLQRDQKVKIVANVFAFFQKDKKKCGLTIQPAKFTFSEIEKVEIPDE